MKPEPALTLVTAIITAVAPYLPEGVRTVRARVVPVWGLQIWAVPANVPVEEGYDFWGALDPSPDGWSAGQRGVASPFGLGTWIPFVPAGLRTRLEVSDALKSIQTAVQRVVSPWPASDAAVKTKLEGRDVLVWFQDSSGRPIFPASRIAL